MHLIQMVDLRRQYQHIKDEIGTAMDAVMESAAFINGPQVGEFAGALAQYNQVKHVIPCANGTDALQIAMMALGLQPGDEVITPSFTFIATAEVIALLGLKPVFVDVHPQTFCIDPDAIEKAITPRTRAIVPVHLYGQAAHMEQIMAVAEARSLFVIEDNAQAIGCDYTFSDGRQVKTGAIGHVSTTSFFPSKNLGCYGDGGAMMTNDEELAGKLKMIANHGQVKRYYHSMVGCNSRLDTIQAAILNVKLKYLDEYISARRTAADFYDQAFAGVPQITTPFRAAYCRHVFHQYTLVLNDVDRDGLHRFLADAGVPSMIYYPVPCHRQEMFEGISDARANLPVTDSLTSRVISLPMHTELQEEELSLITNKILEFINQ